MIENVAVRERVAHRADREREDSLHERMEVQFASRLARVI